MSADKYFLPFFLELRGRPAYYDLGSLSLLGIKLWVYGQVQMSESAVSFVADFHGVECPYDIGPGFGVWEYPCVSDQKELPPMIWGSILVSVFFHDQCVAERFL